MGIIIKNGVIYSPTDYLSTNGGNMTGTITHETNSNDPLIRFTKNDKANSIIGSRIVTGVTGNIAFGVYCGDPDAKHNRTFSINGYESDKFSVRFGNADFGFIEQSTFDLARGATYSGSLISKPFVVLIFPVVGNSGSGATTTTNNPVYTATGMTSTGFTFKNLTDFTKFRYVAFGVPSDYSE